jgi:growth factor-regulated tyrosine kinase substrate
MTLPHLAITEEVRVCDGCYMKNKLAKIEKKEANTTSFPPFMKGDPYPKREAEPIPSKSTVATEEEMDDDLKKAIELSLKEAEKNKSAYGAGYAPPQKVEKKVSPPPSVQPQDDQDDPDLAAAIAASLQDMQIAQNQASQSHSYRGPTSDDLSTVEMENILLFSTLIDRIRASSGEVGSDPQINALYTQIGAIQPKLVKSLDETNRKHHKFVELHSKLNQAVKMYDRLLEERLANSYSRGSHPVQDRVQSPHQYYASPPVSHSAYAPPTNDQNSLYPNAVNYNPPQQQQPSFPQPSAYDQGNDSSSYPSVPQPSSSAPYMYNTPSTASYTSSYPVQQQSGPTLPQEYQAPPGSAPPQEYQPQHTPQGTAPPHQGFMHAQGYFPSAQGTTSPQENYYPPQAPEANSNIPPAQAPYAPPNEYQHTPQGYVSPPNAQAGSGYAPEPYYASQQQAPPSQQQQQQPDLVSPQQQYRPPSQQAPPQHWDGYPQQPYAQQHEGNTYNLPGSAPQQRQQPVVEEAPLIEL